MIGTTDDDLWKVFEVVEIAGLSICNGEPRALTLDDILKIKADAKAAEKAEKAAQAKVK